MPHPLTLAAIPALSVAPLVAQSAGGLPEPVGLLGSYGIAGLLGALLWRQSREELAAERAGRAWEREQRIKAEERAATQADRHRDSMTALTSAVTELQRSMIPAVETLAAEVRAIRSNEHGA